MNDEESKSVSISVSIVNHDGASGSLGHIPENATRRDVLLAAATLLHEIVLLEGHASTAPMRKIRQQVLDEVKDVLVLLQSSEMDGTPYKR